MDAIQDSHVDADAPRVPTENPTLEEGERRLYTQASSEAEAVENIEAWEDDLEAAGVEARVEYVGVDIPEEQCVVGDGAVHEVALIIEEDHKE